MNKAIKWATIMITALLLMYYIICESFIIETNQFKLNYIYKLNDEWNAITEEGIISVNNIEYAGFILEEGQTLNVCRIIPEIDETTYLMFNSNENDVVVYVGNTVRKVYTTKQTQITKSSSARKWIFVELNPEDSGKLIAISLTTDNDNSRGKMEGFYFGNLLSLINYLVKEFIATIILAIVLIALSLASLFICFGLRFAHMRQKALEYLSLTALGFGFLLLIESGIRQFFIQNVQVAENISYVLVNILFIPMLVFIDELQKQRYKYVYLTLEIAILLMTMARIIMQISGIATFNETFIMSGVIIFITLMAPAFTFVRDFMKKRIKDYILSAIGILLVIFATSFELGMDNLGISHYRIIFSILFCIMLLLTFIPNIVKAIKTCKKLNESMAETKSEPETEFEFESETEPEFEKETESEPEGEFEIEPEGELSSEIEKRTEN